MNILEYENYHEEKQHGYADFPYNTYLCTIPLDFKEVPTHWHDEMELIYIKKGTGIVAVDFEEHIVTSPSILFILPGQLHAISQYREDTMEYENIIFSPDMLLSRQPDSTGTNFIHPLIHRRISVPSIFTPAFPYYTEISAPIDACDEICRTRPQGYEFYIKSQLFLFFYLLNRHCRDFVTKQKKIQNLEKMKLIIKYIENHYMDRITIQDIADVADFSESHFMRYFKETLGTTFIDYLRDYRLTMAARLLKGSESAILDIAAECGFDNLSYFNRSFKKKYELTPREYRRSSHE
ncbi:MAG: helix-turn-helix transcriptional regulator [Lachnospiraceae bacterium]|nr:helix-turn-helix transcriptional regulator [Lachnospiraceae bacterium]